MELWKGKVAVVTGSSSGIGAAICKELCKFDVIVVGLARRLERLEELKKEILKTKSDAIFHPVKCDVTVESDIKSAFEYVVKTLGGVDIMINNAGVVKRGTILQEDNLEDLKSVIDTNLIALVSCTKKAFKSMSDRDTPGYIINISSILGYSVTNIPGHKQESNLYASSKFAMRALNTVVRHELNDLKKNKIRLSCVSPGVVDTEMAAGYTIPAMLKAEDVADVVVYILGTNPRIQIEDVIIRPAGEEM